MGKYYKVMPLVDYETLIKKIGVVTYFKSTEKNKRYQTTRVLNETIFFIRLDADMKIEWSIDLAKLYQAYTTLEDFKTISFKPFVPLRHSPARALLFHIGLLEKIK